MRWLAVVFVSLTPGLTWVAVLMHVLDHGDGFDRLAVVLAAGFCGVISAILSVADYDR